MSRSLSPLNRFPGTIVVPERRIEEVAPQRGVELDRRVGLAIALPIGLVATSTGYMMGRNMPCNMFTQWEGIVASMLLVPQIALLRNSFHRAMGGITRLFYNAEPRRAIRQIVLGTGMAAVTNTAILLTTIVIANTFFCR